MSDNAKSTESTSETGTSRERVLKAGAPEARTVQDAFPWTPGPWENGWGVIGTYIEGRHEWTHVATIDEIAENPTESEANARLIAAAPDLYEALEAMLPWHDSHPAEPTENPIINRCRAALAKARGDLPPPPHQEKP